MDINSINVEKKDGDVDVHNDSAPHIPVLLDKAMAALQISSGGDFIDATFGAGGYTKEILKANLNNKVLALDRDPEAIANGASLVEAFSTRLTLSETEFSNMEIAAKELGFSFFDGIILDIGVSSMQLDQALRGFSFKSDGPLDMRMSKNGQSAADLLNYSSEERLADIFFHYGEERFARPIARAVVEERKKNKFTNTKRFAELITKIVHWRPPMIHPATRCFQALRIAVNDELVELVNALYAAERLLKSGGRLVVVSFHSLEDRIVKNFFAARSNKSGGGKYASLYSLNPPTFKIEGKWPIIADEDETKHNYRARSAKMRMGIRTNNPPQKEEKFLNELAILPEEKKRGDRTKQRRESHSTKDKRKCKKWGNGGMNDKTA